MPSCPTSPTSQRVTTVHSRTTQTAIVLGVCAALAGAVPASATSQARPRAGKYAGQETYNNDPLPVTFNVSRDRKRVMRFSGQAEVKGGCTNHITGFQAPTGPMAITAQGRFSASSRNYPQPGVRVKVTGTFVSRVKAKGHIKVRIAKHPGCTASRPFVAQRTP
jgi:hypothetical protein